MAAWLIVLGVIVLAIAYVFYNYFRIAGWAKEPPK